MIAFIVTVRRDGLAPATYNETAIDSSTAVMNAQTRYGACSVFVQVA
ncbi:hypothetical protein [Janthinobacterium sp. PC23-8]|nr:hypothetical protein [Janthinobacterium sp. PC23-8]